METTNIEYVSASDRKQHGFTGWHLIGHCGVDSGQIMLADPCYVNDFPQHDGTEIGYSNSDGPFKFSYNGACDATLSYKHAGELGNGMAVAVSTYYGDGLYPVYAYYHGGRIAQVTIDFAPGEVEVTNPIPFASDEDDWDVD